MRSSGPPAFRRISLVVQGGARGGAGDHAVADTGHDPQGRRRCGCTARRRRVCCRQCGSSGLHDMMSGHIWAQLPRPDLPPRVADSERAFERCIRAGVPCCTSSDWRARAGSWSCCSARLPRTSGTIDGFPIPQVHARQNAVAWGRLRRDRPAACRATAAGSSRLLLYHARARSQRAEPPVDCDSARDSRRRGGCLSALAGSVRRWTSRAFRLRCWRFRCCLSRHWSWAFVIPFACRQICGPGGSFISCGRTISPRIMAGAKTGRGRQAGRARAAGAAAVDTCSR